MILLRIRMYVFVYTVYVCRLSVRIFVLCIHVNIILIVAAYISRAIEKCVVCTFHVHFGTN